MTGTFSFCRTATAIRWLNEGDIMQHLEDETYFKKESGIIFISIDNSHWEKFEKPLETFPPYDEWRSLSNLHYLHTIHLAHVNEDLCKYLTLDDRILDFDDPEADISKKRWFLGGLL